MKSLESPRMFDVIIPPQYTSWFEGLGLDEVRFGYSGIKLFSPSELDKGQVGYSLGVDGRSLCDGRPRGWLPEWLVIGYDTAVGDPFILDTSDEALRVMTTMHGQGNWDPDPIARSLDAFGEMLRVIRKVAVGRAHPVALEQNPLSDAERDRVLEEITHLNGGDVGMDFWKIFLGMEA